MKTIKQWLKECLSKEDYKKVEQYDNKEWEKGRNCFEDALRGAFIWDDTREGHGYWSKIYHSGGSLQPDPNLTVSPKFIKRIHELSSPEVKQQLEQEFPSLILNLEEGVWYNYYGNLLCYTGGGRAYGFWTANWGEDWSLTGSNPEGLKVATEEEVRDALIKEAKKRGYKAGNFACLLSGLTSESVDDYDNWTFLGDSLYTEDFGNGGHVVYKNGKWAELISTTLTLEEAREFIARIRGVEKEEITIQSN